MDKEIIIRNLCDAFEVIKDSWETRKEAICRCITGMVKYDPDIAMDMSYTLLTLIEHQFKRRKVVKHT